MIPIGPMERAHSVPVSRATDELYSEVTPAAVASAAAYADVAGSTIDARMFQSVSYTLVNAGPNTICWKVLGANAATFADAVEVQAEADVLNAGVASYNTQIAVWRYYKVQVKDKVAASHGTPTVRGIAKAG